MTERQATWRRALDTAANALTVALLVGAVVLAVGSWERRSAVGPLERRWDVKHLPVDFRRAERTLVIALKPGCPFCTSSLPFYRELLRVRGDEGRRVQVVVISTAPRSETERYLSAEGVRPDSVLEVASSDATIRAVPAVAIAGEDGGTLYSFVGALSTTEQATVRQLLFGDKTQ